MKDEGLRWVCWFSLKLKWELCAETLWSARKWISVSCGIVFASYWFAFECTFSWIPSYL